MRQSLEWITNCSSLQRMGASKLHNYNAECTRNEIIGENKSIEKGIIDKIEKKQLGWFRPRCT